MTRAAVIAASLAAWLLVIPFVLSHTIPASFWLEVRTVEFSDSVEGNPPRLAVDRTIHRAFRGSFDVDVKREAGSEFVTHCRRHSPGPFDYGSPPAPIPADADLRWWLDIPPNRDCAWLPGRYIVETAWRIYLPLGITLRVDRTSNIFTIHEASQ